MANYSLHFSNCYQTVKLTKWACSALFLLFSFSWLYWFQADMLAVAQHGLSGGKTSYDRMLGALIVTGVLLVLQLIVYAFTRLSRRTHALTYLPSFLLLAFVSSMHYPFRWGAWPWAAPLVLLLWGGSVWLAKKVYPFENDAKEPVALFSRRVWLNLLQMAAMMLGVVALSNTNAVDHYKAHAEVALLHDDAEEALRVGCRSLETDPSLTMLRTFALAQRGELADHLFEYAISGTSTDMLPLAGSHSHLTLLPDTLLWDFLGQRPDSLLLLTDSLGQPLFRAPLTAKRYLDLLAAADTLSGDRPLPYVDYSLVGMLIDRQLDSFVVHLPRSYSLSAPDSLPRHYREALVLYRAQCDTSFMYSDASTENRWYQYMQLDSLYPRYTERRVRTDDSLRATYWYYYHQRQ